MPKGMSCHKAIVVITGRAHCFHDNIYTYIYIYICVCVYVVLHFIYIYILYIYYIVHIYSIYIIHIHILWTTEFNQQIDNIGTFPGGPLYVNF